MMIRRYNEQNRSALQSESSSSSLSILHETIYARAQSKRKEMTKKCKEIFCKNLFKQRNSIASSVFKKMTSLDDLKILLYIKSYFPYDSELLLLHSFCVDLSKMYQALYLKVGDEISSNLKTNGLINEETVSDQLHASSMQQKSLNKYKVYHLAYESLVKLLRLKFYLIEESADGESNEELMDTLHGPVVEDIDNEVHSSEQPLVNYAIHRHWQLLAYHKQVLDYSYSSFKEQYPELFMNASNFVNSGLRRLGDTVNISSLRDGIHLFRKELAECKETYANFVYFLLELKQFRRKKTFLREDNVEYESEATIQYQDSYEIPYMQGLAELITLSNEAVKLKERMIENVIQYRRSIRDESRSSVASLLYQRPLLGYLNSPIRKQTDTRLLQMIRLQDGLGLVYQQVVLQDNFMDSDLLQNLPKKVQHVVRERAQRFLSKLNDLMRSFYLEAINNLQQALLIIERNNQNETEDNHMEIHVLELSSRCYMALGYGARKHSSSESSSAMEDEVFMEKMKNTAKLIEKSRTDWLTAYNEIHQQGISEISKFSMDIHYLQLLIIIADVDESYLPIEYLSSHTLPFSHENEGWQKIERCQDLANVWPLLLLHAKNALQYCRRLLEILKSMISIPDGYTTLYSPWHYLKEYLYWLTIALRAAVLRMDVVHFADQRLFDCADLCRNNYTFDDMEFIDRSYESFQADSMQNWNEVNWVNFLMPSQKEILLDDQQQAILRKFSVKHEEAEALLSRIACESVKYFQSMEYLIHQKDRECVLESMNSGNNSPTVFVA